jgi:serine/threonine-protein kinase
MASSATSSRRERPIQFGKYTLLARIGGGGIGELFLAQLHSAGGFEKLVVIKRILSHLTDKPAFVEMFVAEARTAARISHPNVCQIYELGQVDGRYYMALEYLEGLPLAEVMVARKRAPHMADLRLIASLIAQTAEGLHHAHSLGASGGEEGHVIHGDVNPRNIFVTSTGVAKLLDFGIVKVRGALGQMQTGAIKGTYSYMAPEQLQGDVIDPRSDIFSLGTIAWEAVVGRRLFKRSSDLLTWRAIVEEPIPRPTKFRPDLPPELDEAIMRALARSADERYQSVRELALSVEQAIRPLGAPFTTLAVAGEMEKAFATELGAQRELVFAAHRRQEAGGAGADVAEATEGAEDWATGDNWTRVAEEDYGDLVSRSIYSRTEQLSVPDLLAKLPDEPDGPPAPAGKPFVPAGDLDATAPMLPPLRQKRALPLPSRLPTPPPPPSYVVDEPHGAESASGSAALPATMMDFADPVPVRRPRRWIAPLALLLSAAAGAALVLVLNRRPAPPASAPPAAAEAAPSVVEPVSPPAPAASADVATPAVAPAPGVAARSGSFAGAERGGSGDLAPRHGSGERDADRGREGDRPRAERQSGDKTGSGDGESAREKGERRADRGDDKPRERERDRADATPASAGGDEGEDGFLTINAEPYATLFVDGKKHGFTPVVRLSLGPGEHRLRLVSSDGQPDKKMRVRIVSGQELRRSVKW